MNSPSTSLLIPFPGILRRKNVPNSFTVTVELPFPGSVVMGTTTTRDPLPPSATYWL